MGNLPVVTGINNSAHLVYSPGSALENQFITNVGLVTVYLGGSTVTTATGLPFPPGSTAMLERNGGAVYAIAAAGALGEVSVSVGIQG